MNEQAARERFAEVDGHKCIIEVFQERIDGEVRSNLWCSYVPALGIVSQGSTAEEAFEHAKEHVLAFAQLFTDSAEMTRVPDSEWKTIGDGKISLISSPVKHRAK